VKEIVILPIGVVLSSRSKAEDDDWDSEESSILLDERFEEEALTGLTDFSHVEVIYHFDKTDESKVVTGARHPRNNPSWPKVGIFSQRGKNRPNRLGVTICQIIGIEGRRLKLKGLDAIDGTPVIDIKPVMAEFLPRGRLAQPDWSKEIMSRYWE